MRTQASEKRRKKAERQMVQIEQIFFRPSEAALALGCSRTRIYELVHAGLLPHVRLGGTSIRIPKAAIQKLVDDAMKARNSGK
jgi:excisionase family DNA binding protein